MKPNKILVYKLAILYIAIFIFNQANSQISFQENAELLNLADANSSWGLSFVDFDNDEDLDVYICNGYIGEVQQSNLMRNLGSIFQNVSSLYGVDDTNPTTCASWADFDNDGDLDLFTTNSSDLNGTNELYRNDGDIFTDVTDTYGFALMSNYNSVSFCNINQDQYNDIFILGSYTSDYLYKGNGTGFDTQAFTNPDGTGYVQLFADLTGDFKPELILGNSLGPLYVYEYIENNFVDVTSELGFENVEKVSGMAASDIDNDEDFDLIFAVNTGNTDQAVFIFENLTDTFVDVSSAWNVTKTGRGKCVTALDADKDGFTDFYVGIWNNHGILLHNTGTTFSEISADFNTVSSFPISLVSGDTDNDGDMDIYQSTYEIDTYDTENYFWVNNTVSSNNYLKIKLKSSFAYLNSIVKLYTNNNTYVKELRGNSGSLNQTDELFFGLSSAEEVIKAGVTWSNDIQTEESFTIDDINIRVELEQGTGSIGIQNQMKSFDFSLQPNPASNKILIQVPKNIKRSDIKIYNTTGKLVLNRNAYADNQSVVIDVSNLKAGIYFIKVTGNNFSYKAKTFVISR